MKHTGFDTLHPMHQCQILTNLANNLSHIGRFTEAVELWDRALRLNPKFGMARGNRGYALSNYAMGLYDRSHAQVMLVAAHDALRSARAKAAFYEADYVAARAFFKAREDDIAGQIPVAKIRGQINLDNTASARASERNATAHGAFATGFSSID